MAHQIGSSLVTGSNCFLDSVEWLSVFEDECEYIGSWDELQAKLIPVYATLPSLMRDVKSQEYSASQVSGLLARAWHFRRQLQDLESIANQTFSDPDSVEETQNTSSDSPFEISYRFSSAVVAQPLLLYWRLIIIINSVIHNLLARTEARDFDVKELKVSSIHAADQIAISAQNGRQSKPVVSVVYSFGLPAAIWAYTNHEFREWKQSSERDWLLELLYEYLKPMNTAVRAITVKYWDAVGLPCSGVPISPESDSDDRAK